MTETVDWATASGLRWAFTLSNAGALYFEDRCDLANLGEIDWNAVRSRDWRRCKEGKQAEFLVERKFPWHLISSIGVQSQQCYSQVVTALQGALRKPRVEIRPDWYY